MGRSLTRTLLLALLLGAAPSFEATDAAAQGRAPVIVTPGSARNFRAAVKRFEDASIPSDAKLVASFRQAIGEALEFSGIFQVVDPKAFLAPETSLSFEKDPPPVCSDWTQIGTDALLEGRIRRDTGDLSVEFHVYDVVRCRRLLRKRYKIPATSQPERIAKRIADDTVEAFVGIKGVAGTEIAFVSDRKGNKEIFVMDADGVNQRAATANGSINNFPAWSPDGDSILYTSYRRNNRPMLFLSSRIRGRPGRLLEKVGEDVPQYRGVFSRSGERIAVVMSTNGAADIFTARSDGARLEQLTKNRVIDVSPTWSPDGKRIAFVSDRTGAPQVYVMDSDGSNTQRVTYQGTYNTNPAWSPDGQWIAYESRLESQFDIWLIDLDGHVNVPLLNHPRSDEAPTWAPNSRKLAFSSKRRGRADIYVVDVSGENLQRITEGAGNNTSPDWGPFPR